MRMITTLSAAIPERQPITTGPETRAFITSRLVPAFLVTAFLMMAFLLLKPVCPASSASFEPFVTIQDACEEMERIEAEDLKRINAALDALVIRRSSTTFLKRTALWIECCTKSRPVWRGEKAPEVKESSEIAAASDAPEQMKEVHRGSARDFRTGYRESAIEAHVEKDSKPGEGTIQSSPVPDASKPYGSGAGDVKASVDYPVSPETMVKVNSSRDRSESLTTTSVGIEKKIGGATTIEMTGTQGSGPDTLSTGIGGKVSQAVGEKSTIELSGEHTASQGTSTDNCGARVIEKFGKNTTLGISAQKTTEESLTTGTCAMEMDHAFSSSFAMGMKMNASSSTDGSESASSEVTIQDRPNSSTTIAAHYALTEIDDDNTHLAGVSYELSMKKYMKLHGAYEHYMTGQGAHRTEVGIKREKGAEQFGLTFIRQKETPQDKDFFNRLFLMYVKKF